MSDIAELHKQLDHDWNEVLACIPERDFWARMAVFQMWGEEKEYLTRYGGRRKADRGKAATALHEPKP